MIKRKLSGKTQLIFGVLSYFKEEVKTLNRPKFRALKKIISGYIQMKFRTPKRKVNPRKLNLGLDEI